MSTMKFAGIAAAALLAAGGAQAQSLDDMMKKYGCVACHQVAVKVVGPAYNDVAAKYKGNAKAPAMLFDKVKKGGAGVWGEVPMPPNPQVPDADLKALVNAVLALKK
jgi:cytochrome c